MKSKGRKPQPLIRRYPRFDDILSILEKHDTLCMDSYADRKKLAWALTELLEFPD